MPPAPGLQDETSAEAPRLTREDVENFLLETLAPATQQRYDAALMAFREQCLTEEVDPAELSEEELDWFLAELILHAFRTDGMRHQFACLLSALSRVNPRLRLKVAWRVLDVWAVREPPRQAAACPPEVLIRMFMMLVLCDRPELGVGFLVCYAGLLRVREMLSLTGADIIFSGDGVVLCLSRTRRGREQKVVCRNSQTVAWVRLYPALLRPGADDWAFPVQYTTCLRWIKKAAVAAGVGDLNVTTHSLRRSGASELSRRGVA